MEMGMPGFTVEKINEIIGFDNIQNGVLNPDEVPVHVENRIGEEGEGWRAMMEGVNVERTLLAAQAAASLALITRGLVIILFLIFEPRGLAHRWGMIKAYYRLWPFSHEE
jgi:hypothetical protein